MSGPGLVLVRRKFRKIGDYFDFNVGEVVLFLGEIANKPGYCAVMRKDGRVFWNYKIGDFEPIDAGEDLK